MTTIESTSQVLDQPGPLFTLSEDQLAAIAFLVRYRGRTGEAYRGSSPWASEPGSARSTPTRRGPGSSWPPSTPGYPLPEVQVAARHPDPRTTTVYDRRRQDLDPPRPGRLRRRRLTRSEAGTGRQQRSALRGRCWTKAASRRRGANPLLIDADCEVLRSPEILGEDGQFTLFG